MPRRSNPFQRLATLVHERLGKDWKVEESHLFRDLVTGEWREVDIVAQCTIAIYPIFLSIECRDHARPADVVWIEAMAKKHEHLPTSKLVLWSRSGFTKSALRKAGFLKIVAVSQVDAVRTEWAHLARKLMDSQLQYVTPKYTPFIDVSLPTSELRRLDDVANAAWYNSEGAQIGTVSALIQLVASSHVTREIVLDNTTVGKGDFYVELKPQVPWFTDLPDGGRVPVRRIGIGIETVTEKVSVKTASALSEGKVLTLASSSLASGTLEVLVCESPEGFSSFKAELLPKKA